MASDDVQTNLRIPAALKEKLLAAAAESGRSLSAEVTQRLESSFEDELASVTLKSQMGDDVSMSVTVPMGKYSDETLERIRTVFEEFAYSVKRTPN